MHTVLTANLDMQMIFSLSMLLIAVTIVTYMYIKITGLADITRSPMYNQGLWGLQALDTTKQHFYSIFVSPNTQKQIYRDAQCACRVCAL